MPSGDLSNRQTFRLRLSAPGWEEGRIRVARIASDRHLKGGSQDRYVSLSLTLSGNGFCIGFGTVLREPPGKTNGILTNGILTCWEGEIISPGFSLLLLLSNSPFFLIKLARDNGKQ